MPYFMFSSRPETSTNRVDTWRSIEIFGILPPTYGKSVSLRRRGVQKHCGLRRNSRWANRRGWLHWSGLLLEMESSIVLHVDLVEQRFYKDDARICVWGSVIMQIGFTELNGWKEGVKGRKYRFLVYRLAFLVQLGAILIPVLVILTLD